MPPANKALQEVTAPIEFPLLGVDLSTERDLQRPATTILAINVRAQDPFAQRTRGGSRTGLSRYINARVNGVNPIQCLGFIVTQDPDATLFAFDQVSGPGPRITDTSTSNFPDGPGGPGPGGGPHPPMVGGNPPFNPFPFTTGFNARIPPNGRTVPDGGSGVMMVRQIGNASPPSPPSPPGMVTRTYTPYSEFLGGEFLPVFSVGPFTLPLTPPTDLAPTIIASGGDSCGTAMLADLATWGGVALPTLAEINALVLSHGCSYGPPGTGGPYQFITDT